MQPTEPQQVRMTAKGRACTLHVDGHPISGVQKIAFFAENTLRREFRLDVTLRVKDLVVEGDLPIAIERIGREQAPNEAADLQALGLARAEAMLGVEEVLAMERRSRAQFKPGDRVRINDNAGHDFLRGHKGTVDRVDDDPTCPVVVRLDYGGPHIRCRRESVDHLPASIIPAADPGAAAELDLRPPWAKAMLDSIERREKADAAILKAVADVCGRVPQGSRIAFLFAGNSAAGGMADYRGTYPSVQAAQDAVAKAMAWGSEDLARLGMFAWYHVAVVQGGRLVVASRYVPKDGVPGTWVPEPTDAEGAPPS